MAGEEPAARVVAEDLGLPAEGSDPGRGDGVVFVGDDRALARFALAVGPGVPILYVPSGPSDLARMFALGDRDVGSRLESGVHYPADLLLASCGGDPTPVIGHAIASRTGRLPTWMVRRDHVSVEVNGRIQHHEAAGVVVANAQHVGGLTVAPRAALMDGRADVQIIGGTAPHRIRSLRAMRRGLHLRMPGIERRSFRRLLVEIPSRWILTLDGAPTPGGRWEFVVVPSAITLWV